MNIAITGAGIVSAIGLNKTEVLSSLLSKQTGIGKMRYLNSSHRELPVGEVKLTNEEMKLLLGIAVEKEFSRTALMAMMATHEALTEAHLTTIDGKRIVFISGTTVGGMDVTEKHYADLQTDTCADYIRYHDCGSCTKQIADHFGLFADVTTISTACSSAANALIVGADMIKSGEADIVVAGGTEALSLFHLNGFNSLMILDHELCRPFDDTRAGLNLGEGAAYVVLESDLSAAARCVEPMAYLTGYGNACDAYHQTASSPDGEGAYLAMNKALTMAKIKSEEIQYVNAHGTGTPNNDMAETVALKRLFGNHVPAVSSTKSFTGHTTSASGSIETVICLLAMRNNFIPANLHWKNQMEDGIIPSSGEECIPLRHILCNSFGFGGNDSSLVLSVHPVGEESGELSCHECQQLSVVEATDEDSLGEIRNYIKPLEARRMGKLMKASLLTSLKALEQAGVSVPDAIVTGTAYGCVVNSEEILQQLSAEGEETVSPTLFMQSTHNTISSNIAIRLKCHGYNLTYTQGDQSLEWAVKEGTRLIKTGQCRTVLVGYHDESTPLFRQLMGKVGNSVLYSIYSISMVLSCK